MSDAATTQSRLSAEFLAGASLAAAAALSVLVMAHHPTGTAHAATLGRAVHGAMMALVVVMLAGFIRFAAARGLDRFAVALALTLYAAAAFANLLAGSINGFVVPALLERNAYEANAVLLWTLNQTFARAAVFAASAAFALWGADLAARGRGAARLVGVAGIVAGALPAALLAMGVLDMHVAGAFVIYAGQASFTALAGIYLATRKS
jgi:hypothetical protein